MHIPVTSHARARMQQRGIGAEALDILLSYGREAYDHHGAVILYMDKAAQRRLASASEIGRAHV